jgi:hypothetical protein
MPETLVRQLYKHHGPSRGCPVIVFAGFTGISLIQGFAPDWFLFSIATAAV